MRLLGLLTAAAFALACSNTGGIVTTDGLGQGDTKTLDSPGVSDIEEGRKDSTQDIALIPEDVLSFELLGDTGNDLFVPGCEPGEGCFLDKCDDNSQCQSGWCVDHLGEGVCSSACQEECPQGWSCEQVGSGPDVTFICVSSFANLCRPCATGADCKSVGGAEDVCLDYGSEGSFCGGACAADDDCPWGFSCVDTHTVEGVGIKQCVADSGVCPCTTKSVALALTTPCEMVNEFGTCEGLRVCTEEGLTGCDAAQPIAETCNGLDDDCDGEVDEPVLFEGEYVGLCDDGSECTADACLGESGCEHEALNEGECKDGDVCTVGDHCEAGVCSGQPVACDDGNPCTDDVCDGLGGCAAEFNAAACDDGNPCTVNDTCSQGECVGYDIDCSCQTTADCGQFEDGDLCNGTLYCDTSSLPYQCQVAEETVVVCPVLEGQEAICAQAACDPATGECSVQPNHTGYACDDGNACTVGDKCGDGACQPGVAMLCNDNNPCTDDSCDVESGCVNEPNAAACNDGDPCTTVDVCVDGVCTGSQFKICSDNNPCTLDSCVTGEGCFFEPWDGQCDDGNACTLGDSCKDGFCVSTGMLNCDDDNVCTDDACDPSKGCITLLNASPCDDGDVCTFGDHCSLGECNAAGQLNCNDSNPCTDDSCDSEIGCQFVPNSAACDDGTECTEGDTCAGGICKGTLVDCDDGTVCTKDWCDVELGCQHSNLDGPCSDGTDCTVGDKCVAGNCVPGPLLNCDDGNVCTDDSCDPQAGCQNVANILPCDDSNECTVDDVCADGVCLPGGPLDCDDGNVCTDDACAPDKGCIYVLNDLGCDDGDQCTENDVCAAGECTGGPAIVCDDGDACTNDSCTPEDGCVYEAFFPCCGNGILEDGEECDDGNHVGGDGCEEDCTEFTALDVTFTNCSKTGPTGPSQASCDSAYNGLMFLDGKVTVSAGVQLWTVPFTGTYRLEAYGAKGGCNGGAGARMRGDFELQKGTQLKIIVGQQGLCAPASVGNGGGGGTFVATADNTPLIVAGGGGGTGHNSYSDYDMTGVTGINGIAGKYSGAGAGGTNGNGGKESYTTGNGTPNGGGGGGFLTDGGSSGAARGGKSFLNGGAGGDSTGGFGGGGGSNYFVYGCGSSPHGGSGGGGYSGGGAGGDNCNGPAGGGGSWNSGANQSNSKGANSGHGKVHFLRL